jgi:polysaccharide pyruvyl transferase WcaK-like protein
MSIQRFFAEHQLNKSLLIGFYGGGNYGDELLMEVLTNLFKQNNYRDISISYQTPPTFSTFHHDLGYTLVPMFDKKALFKAIFKNKHILIGGGGLWGLDVNNNIFILSAILFFSRWILGKKVYLLGVGYYSSTNRLGHISAWLAGKAANAIIARDPETQQSFSRINKHVSLDSDIAWHIPELDLAAYQADVAQINQRLHINKKTLFVTLRRFRKEHQNNYAQVIEQMLKQNTDKNIVVAILEPRTVDSEGYAQLEAWQKQYSNMQILDFSFNPLALFLFFKQHADNLVMISPQFHALITAHLTGVAFLPLVYDNKSAELLREIGIDTHIHIKNITLADVQSFINGVFK